MNINNYIFSEVSPKEKLEKINSLTKEELFQVTKSTIAKIIHEVGKGKEVKNLFFKNPVSNDNNAYINYVFSQGGNIYFNIYIQGDSTDGWDSCTVEDLLKKDITGTFEEAYNYDSHIYTRNVHATFRASHRTKVIKEVLINYICNKYGIKNS